MKRFAKVLCSPAEQDRLSQSHRLIERYDGFGLFEVDADRIAALAASWPVEDVTDQFAIPVGDEYIDTSMPRIDTEGKRRSHPAYGGAGRLAPGKHHYLVQFIGPVKQQWLEQVTEVGGEPRTPFAGFTYVVRASDKARALIAALPCVRWVGHLRHEQRIDRNLRARSAGTATATLPRTRTLPDSYSVEFFDERDMKAGLTVIKKLGFQVSDKDAGAAVAVVRDSGRAGAAKRLRALSAVHGVWRIRGFVLKRTTNDVARGIMGAITSVATPGLGLTGEGETIAIADTGLDTGAPATLHGDFAGRIQAIVSYPIAAAYAPYVTNPGADDGAADLDSGHGTHVAGSAVGDGSASVGLPGVTSPIRGLAHRARLVFQAIEQEMKWRNAADLQRYGRYLLTGIPSDLKTLFGDAYARGARIHSNSWGGGDPGAYDEQCEQLDEFVWTHKDFCVLVANGNDGTDGDGDGTINAMSVSAPATAKNCISVGASENVRHAFDSDTYGSWWPSDYPVAPFRNDAMADDDEDLAAFSSRGPTRDGRIKPDVVAPGTFILSTRSTMIAPNNMAWAGFAPSRLYFHMGGTSMATPLVAGAVGLVRQYLRTVQQIPKPSAALLKASLIAGAARLGGGTVVADNDQGFGRVDLDAILSPAAPATARFLDVKPGLRTGEVHTTNVSVATRETALRIVLVYSDSPGPNLINNLNLVAQAPDGARFVGNQAAGGGLALDTVNNVEVVQVKNPTPGAWTVQVTGSNVPDGPQDFALVVLGHLGEPVAAGAGVEVQAAPNLPIPDNTPAGVSSTQHVDRQGAIAGIRVSVDIAHTYIGDLQVLLTAPGNQQVALHSRQGGSANDLVATYDLVTIPDLARFVGIDARGDWTLTVIDRAAIDVGVLRTWRLALTLADTDPYRAASEPGLQIPDDDPVGIRDAVDIGGPGPIHEVRVSVDITHTYIGDLRVTLRSPSGTDVVLHDRQGFSADNIIRTYEPATTPALAAFAGEPAAGSWTLSVIDLAGRDVGKLNRWELRIAP
ncbi:MAG TPA: proprotein convertase P-domain-containing protein [Planctomycetota bacterium]|nr:proprotein convertase P-domain-containing protein [Planctomycetota bacterium]